MVNKIHDYHNLQDFLIKTLQHQHADQDNKIPPYTQSTLLSVINKYQLSKKKPQIETRQLLDYVINPLILLEVLEFEESTKTYNLSKDYLILVPRFNSSTVEDYVIALRVVLNAISSASLKDWYTQKTKNKIDQKTSRMMHLQAQEEFSKLLDMIFEINSFTFASVINQLSEHFRNEQKHLLELGTIDRKSSSVNSASSTLPESQTLL